MSMFKIISAIIFMNENINSHYYDNENLLLLIRQQENWLFDWFFRF